MGSFLVGRSQKRYNLPVEVCFLSVNDIILVGVYKSVLPTD